MGINQPLKQWRLKKIYLASVTLLCICFITGCKEAKVEDNITFPASASNKSRPQLLTFSFQPSLQVNTEVIVNFEKKYLLFRNTYPYVAEPPPPPEADGKSSAEHTDKRLAVMPYSCQLSETELDYIAEIVRKLEEKDFKKVDGMYIDGISCNFSLLGGDGSYRNGFIASDMTENQRMLYLSILNLLYTTNEDEGNRRILNNYRNYSGN